MLKYSEACLICATWLLVSGNTVIGYSLLAFSMLLGFARFSIQLQEQKEKKKNFDDSVDAISSVISNLSNFGVLNGKYPGKNEISH